MTRSPATQTIRVRKLRGSIDFAIITVREDEFKAVLKRFSPHRPVTGGREFYEYCRLRTLQGYLRVAMVRTFEQGQTAAQQVAHNTIEDLDPKWLILCG